jgi:hypothetical protein
LSGIIHHHVEEVAGDMAGDAIRQEVGIERPGAAAGEEGVLVDRAEGVAVRDVAVDRFLGPAVQVEGGDESNRLLQGGEGIRGGHLSTSRCFSSR